MKWLRWLLPAAAGVGLACVIYWWPHIRNEWFVITGTRNEPGGYYAFLSGSGSDISEIAIFGAVIGAYHRVNCHVKGCWRIGRQHVEGSTFVVCRKHHPSPKPTHAHILALHRQHQARIAEAGEKTAGPIPATARTTGNCATAATCATTTRAGYTPRKPAPGCLPG